jgi:hypothetical protein
MAWNESAGFPGETTNLPAWVRLGDDGMLEVLWGDLSTHKATEYVPDALLKQSAIFPVPLYTPELAKSFADPEVLAKMQFLAILDEYMPLSINTSVLFTLLSPIKADAKTTVIDSVLFYYSVAQLFNSYQTPRHCDIYKQEVRHVESTRDRNLLESGMFQHYFTEQRHPDAPRELCREMVAYTLRRLQAIERHLLRIGGIEYDDAVDAMLLTSSVLPEQLDHRVVSARLWSGRLGCMNLPLGPELHPQGVAPPTAEFIEHDERQFFGVTVGLAEGILWLVQAYTHKPESFRMNV